MRGLITSNASLLEQMNIHEYQAKELLEKFGVATTPGKVASTPDEAEAIAREISKGMEDGVAGRPLQPSDAAPPKDRRSGAETVDLSLGTDLVVKAQVHAGGRGKGTFKNGFKGGVHVVKSAKEAREVAEKMLGQTLVTHQTGPEGVKVGKLLVEQATNIAHEYYVAIVLDRAVQAPVLIASAEGGMDIEEVAAKTPEKRLHA